MVKIVHVRKHYNLYIDSVFYCSCDTMQEAEQEASYALCK